jgi:hypothetical protein
VSRAARCGARSATGHETGQISNGDPATEGRISTGVDMVVDRDFRRERVRVFESRLTAEPVLRIDNREVVAARFVDPYALRAEAGLPPFIRAYLGGARPAS